MEHYSLLVCLRGRREEYKEESVNSLIHFFFGFFFLKGGGKGIDGIWMALR